MTTIRYYNARRQKYYYADINGNYTVDAQDIQLKSQQAVLGCFVNLIMTTPGDIWFEPTFGAGIPDLLFNNAVASSVQKIFVKSELACQKWLPMVTVDTTRSSVSNLDRIVGKADLSYVMSINQASPITLGLTVYSNK